MLELARYVVLNLQSTTRWHRLLREALAAVGSDVDSRQATAASAVAAPHGTVGTGIVAAVIRAAANRRAGLMEVDDGADHAGLSFDTGADASGTAGSTAQRVTGADVPVVARAGGIKQVLLTSPTGSAQIVRTSAPSTRIPNASLYIINPSRANYLIETDPRFANNRLWMGSDYMLGQLQLDPSVTQKRLGDGFYEQSLVRAQVAQLTGRRFLSDDDEYRALMDAGVAYAKTYNVRPGIALSSAQMAVLSSDIVWLVEQDVTLADGSVQKVLVPQVYVRVRDGDIDGSGALLVDLGQGAEKISDQWRFRKSQLLSWRGSSKKSPKKSTNSKDLLRRWFLIEAGILLKLIWKRRDS